MVAEQMEELATLCGKPLFRKDEELFLTIYTTYLWAGRKLSGITLKQGGQIERLWNHYLGV